MLLIKKVLCKRKFRIFKNTLLGTNHSIYDIKFNESNIIIMLKERNLKGFDIRNLLKDYIFFYSPNDIFLNLLKEKFISDREK
tara:strand:- start:481 stop:729 length:249 start_codon:yes stop_codon:yes gene_type:complete